jgi:formate dehydrogenase alpha subunit
MARKEPQTLTMTIDRRKVYFPEGVTVLRAAELNGIDIPSLCSHKDLSPYGGCRLCMVEIQGMRGTPLSCNTTAQEGMIVATDTEMLRDLRREILKLILSEHPSSCLICGEKDECRDFQGTIRKTGVTTGCRFCPNDGECELQDVVEKIGVTDIDHPILYHGYEPEHDDPFYDRDYNICILCGRCVRMCQEVRGSSVLAFTARGPRVKIGPAFGRTHRDAGCEFCGACVDVCPTGALADKSSKWDGKPDGFRVSTCPFCPLGCQIELYHKNGRLSKAKANLDPEVNDGQLCLKGRFCQPEVTHHFARARKPVLHKGDFFREVSWPEALEKVAGALKKVRPEEFLMLVSPDLTNESLFAAQKFVRDGLESGNIDSTARLELGGGLNLWSSLFSLPISIRDIARSDVILAVGIDTRFNFSVVGTKVRRALDLGAKLVTIDPRDSNLARYTDDWLRPVPGREGRLLKFFAERLTGREADAQAAASEAAVASEALERALDVLSSGGELTVIVGPRVFHYEENEDLVDGLRAMAARPNTNFIPLYFGTNARGALEMGVFPEIGPGATPLATAGAGLVELSGGSRRFKVIYLVGDVPFLERPDCDFLIVQDIYRPPFDVDAFLPASSFAESGGTLINMEGRVQEIVQVEDRPEGSVAGFMRPDWLILSDLADALDTHRLNYKTANDILKDIRASIPSFPERIHRKRRRMTFAGNGNIPGSTRRPIDEGTFWLVADPGGYRHRGIDISSKVGGLDELAPEEGFRMHPDDIAALGLKSGDRIKVTMARDKLAVSGSVKSDIECPAGAVFYTRPVIFGGLSHRREFLPLTRLVSNPTRVEVGPAETRS